MDLKDILEKNKHKVLRLPNIKMPSVATVAIEDRPYNIDFDNGAESLQNHKKNVDNKGPAINRETNGKQSGNPSGGKQVTNKKQIVGLLRLPSFRDNCGECPALCL